MKLKEIHEFIETNAQPLLKQHTQVGYNLICPVTNTLVAWGVHDKRYREGIRYHMNERYRLPDEKAIQRYNRCVEGNKRYHEMWQWLRKSTKWSRRTITAYMLSGFVDNLLEGGVTP